VTDRSRDRGDEGRTAAWPAGAFGLPPPRVGEWRSKLASAVTAPERSSVDLAGQRDTATAVPLCRAEERPVCNPTGEDRSQRGSTAHATLSGETPVRAEVAAKAKGRACPS
jgi:hypothetical protein